MFCDGLWPSAINLLCVDPGMKRRELGLSSGGFTRIELAVVILSLAILGLVLVSYRAQTKEKSRSQTCWNNLKEISVAFKVWPPDALDAFPMKVSQTRGGTQELVATGATSVHFLALSNVLSTPKMLVCPSDNAKSVASSFADFSDRNVSYFIGLDADDSMPQTFLSGDRNLAHGDRPLGAGIFTLTTNMHLSWTSAIHVSKGHILLADSSVHFGNSSALLDRVVQQGLPTNRLVIP